MPRNNAQKIQRCQLIKDLISNNLYNLNDLIIEVNKKFKASNRTIDGDIRAIKDGILGIPIKIEFTSEGVYRINYDVSPFYGETDSRHIPLLTKLLQPFNNVSDVKEILKKLIQKHDGKMGISNCLNNAIEFTSPGVTTDPEVLRLALEIIGQMISEVAIKFNYYGVHQPNKNTDNLRTIFPLQIRELMGRYYLKGLDIYKEPIIENLETFAFDEIWQLKIGSAFEDLEELKPIKYNYKELFEKIEYNKYHEHAIGVWIRPNKEPEIIERYFAGWAASHVLACPIHKSQKLVEDMDDVKLNHIKDFKTRKNLITRVVKVSWNIYKTPELQFRLGAYRDYSWNTDEFDQKGPTVPINWKF